MWFAMYVTATNREISFSVSECGFVCECEELCVVEMCRKCQKNISRPQISVGFARRHDQKYERLPFLQLFAEFKLF